MSAHDPLCPWPSAAGRIVAPLLKDCAYCDLIARVRADERKSEAELVTSLARWKNEATEVLAGWERVYEALGSPGAIGQSKAAAALAHVKSRQAHVHSAGTDTGGPCCECCYEATR